MYVISMIIVSKFIFDYKTIVDWWNKKLLFIYLIIYMYTYVLVIGIYLFSNRFIQIEKNI